MIAVLMGDEPYAIDKYKKKFTLGITDVSRFEGDFSSEIVSVCRSFSLFSDKKAVILRIDTLKSLDNKEFLEYLEAPDPECALIIICGKADKRAKMYKHLQKKRVIVECNKLTEQADLEKVILHELSKHGALIKQSAFKLFIQRLNYFESKDMNLLQAVQFVQVLASVSKEITEDVVKAHIPSFEMADVFSLSSLIARGDSEALMKGINLLPDGDAIKVLSLIQREIRIAYKLHYYRAADIGIREDRAVFKDRPVEALGDALEAVNDAIEAIKQGRLTDGLALRQGCVKAMRLLAA